MPGGVRDLCRGEAPDPRVGSWEEVAGASDDYRAYRRVIEVLEDGALRLTVDARLDPATRWRVEFRCDGRPYPVIGVDGAPVGQALHFRRSEADRTFNMTLRRRVPGKPADEQTRMIETVSPDGQRYTVVAWSRKPDGRDRVIWREFERMPATARRAPRRRPTGSPAPRR